MEQLCRVEDSSAQIYIIQLATSRPTSISRGGGNGCPFYCGVVSYESESNLETCAEVLDHFLYLQFRLISHKLILYMITGETQLRNNTMGQI